MKRHQSFISLSREHHDGLLLATRLQQGRKALLRLWSHDLHWQAEFTVKFYDDNLANHFRMEEEIIFPAAEQFIPDNELRKRLLREHQEMREMVEFLRHPDEKKLECTLTRFGELLESHIRCEEREYFPLCETSVPEHILNDLGTKMERYPT
jgi:hemerythrin-like domain-containing protein